MSMLQQLPATPEHDDETDPWEFHLLRQSHPISSLEGFKIDGAQREPAVSPLVSRRRQSLKRRSLSSEDLVEIRSTKRRNSQIITGTDGPCDHVPPTHRCSNRRQSCLEYPADELDNLTKIRTTTNGFQLRELQEQNQMLSSQFIDPFTSKAASNTRRESGSSSASGYLRPNAFTGHRDTLARLHTKEKKSNILPPEVVSQIMCLLSFQDYKNTRLTCRVWHDILPKPKLPAKFHLPAEVIQQIYGYLEPHDFDAARHTCRSWFLASLDRAVGRKMLDRAGCRAAFQVDLNVRRRLIAQKTVGEPEQFPSDVAEEIQESFYEEWMISKRLATECRLSAAWHGSSVSEESGHSTSRLAVTEVIDFHNLGLLDTTKDREVKTFTTSTCGKFVLVIVDTDIFIYSLSSSSSTVQPCVRLATSKKILSVSMDSSSGRYAVAALFVGSMGACWELDDIFAAENPTTSFHGPRLLGTPTDVYGVAISDPISVLPASMLERQREYSLTLNGRELQAAIPSAGFLQQHSFRSDNMPFCLYNSPPEQSSPAYSEVELPDYFEDLSVPVRTKPTHIYKRLGYSNDEPLSVAICPQRQCVAFGCRTGIELHWVDVLTGRNLNRWFPLSAPSENLYFLPQRSGVDSSTKLRLISSASDPTLRNSGRHNSAPSKWNSGPATRIHGRRQSMTRLFFGNIPFPSSIGTYDTGIFDEQETQGILRTVDCDHYRAVPLSDGTHVLFTDPITGYLCLGSDAPLGGPTKLIRKVIMVPPRSDRFAIGDLRCYAASHDLRFGVRVVAAYDDGSVVLYNIPSDHFDRIRKVRSTADVWDELAGVVGQSDLLMDTLMVDNPDTNGSPNPAGTYVTDSSIYSRALRINGAYVGRVGQDVEDLHLDCSNGGLKVWLFQHDGHAIKMDLYAPRNYRTESYVVGIDGLITSTQATKNSEGRAMAEVANENNCQTRVAFMGFDGTSDVVIRCNDTDLDDQISLLEELSTKSQTLEPEPAGDEALHMNGLRMNAKFELEVLTDWRNGMLLSPYLVRLE